MDRSIFVAVIVVVVVLAVMIVATFIFREIRGWRLRKSAKETWAWCESIAAQLGFQSTVTREFLTWRVLFRNDGGRYLEISEHFREGKLIIEYGDPVSDRKSSINFPSDGKYHACERLEIARLVRNLVDKMKVDDADPIATWIGILNCVMTTGCELVADGFGGYRLRLDGLKSRVFGLFVLSVEINSNLRLDNLIIRENDGKVLWEIRGEKGQFVDFSENDYVGRPKLSPLVLNYIKDFIEH